MPPESTAWLTRTQASAYLGLPRSQLKRLLAAGFLRSQGKGKGLRLNSADVAAVAVLWDRLDKLLPAADPADEDDDD